MYAGGEALEVVKKTKSMIQFLIYQHTGRSNERIQREGQTKVLNWGEKEVAFIGGSCQINADEEWSL